MCSRTQNRSENLQHIANKLGYVGFLHDEPDNKHIWIFWQQGVQIQMLIATSQVLTVLVNIGGIPSI